jgi:arsenical pump membrane protein
VRDRPSRASKATALEKIPGADGHEDAEREGIDDTHGRPGRAEQPGTRRQPHENALTTEAQVSPSDVVEQLRSVTPALAFLLVGVPLAALLDRLGFFDAIATALARRYQRVPVAALWTLATVTTVVLNLDTTVMLLTPLFVRFARRAGVDPVPLAAVPLLLASLASSVLPVSNLTTLIAVDQLGLSVGDVVSHLELPSIVASIVGWLVYRRRFPTNVVSPPAGEPDRPALTFGGVVVATLLVAFVLGPIWSVQPWMAVAVADVALVARTRWVPWRELPIATAASVLALAAAIVAVVPGDATSDVLGGNGPLAIVGLSVTATVAANVVNNLPAVLVVVDRTQVVSWEVWAWLLGVNTGAVLLPIGALANLLWWRITRAEGVSMSFRRYVSITVPIALPALAGAVAVLVAERALAR